MTTAQLNSTQNGHSKAITDISQVTIEKTNISNTIERIKYLLERRTGKDAVDWQRISRACNLIHKCVQDYYWFIKDKIYFTTEVECCYCGHKNQAKLYVSHVKQYVDKTFQTTYQSFEVNPCNNKECKRNLKSSWRPTDGTWQTRPSKYTYTTKSKKKSTIPVRNAAFSSKPIKPTNDKPMGDQEKTIQPTDNSLNHTLIELHHRVSSEKILNAIQTKQYSAVLQELANQIEVYTKLLELL